MFLPLVNSLYRNSVLTHHRNARPWPGYESSYTFIVTAAHSHRRQLWYFCALSEAFSGDAGAGGSNPAEHIRTRQSPHCMQVLATRWTATDPSVSGAAMTDALHRWKVMLNYKQPAIRTRLLSEFCIQISKYPRTLIYEMQPFVQPFCQTSEIL